MLRSTANFPILNVKYSLSVHTMNRLHSELPTVQCQAIAQLSLLGPAKQQSTANKGPLLCSSQLLLRDSQPLLCDC